MAHISNQASKNKVTYMNGKAPKDKAEDFIYLDLQIMDLYNRLGAEEAIKYLKDKIKRIKQMEQGGQIKWVMD